VRTALFFLFLIDGSVPPRDLSGLLGNGMRYGRGSPRQANRARSSLASNLLAPFSMNRLQQLIAAERPIVEALRQAMRREAATLFPREPVMIGSPDAARYRLECDRAAGTDSLFGEWLDVNGHRVGVVVCHAGGQCFAEHDIVRPHPHDRRWFVEAVEAWGVSRGRASENPPDSGVIGDIRAEIRLLPALSGG
jgi:hypothetical protein